MESIVPLAPYIVSALLLLIRLIVAFAFFVSALNKAKAPHAAAQRNGLPFPVLLFVMCAEFAGALGLATGVLGQLAALGLMLLMTATIIIHIFVWKSPYWASKGGWEYDLMLFALCATIVVVGLGDLSLGALFM